MTRPVQPAEPPRVLLALPEFPAEPAAACLRELVEVLGKVASVDLCAGAPSESERRTALGARATESLRWRGLDSAAFLELLKRRIASESYRAVLVLDGPGPREVLDQLIAFAVGAPVVVVSLPGLSRAAAPPRRRPSARPPAAAWAIGGEGTEAVRDLLALSSASAQRPTPAWVRARLSELQSTAPPKPQGGATIVIPCWNGLRYTKECLRSVLARTGDCEVIVVDNGSTDGTPEYVAALKDPRLSLIRNSQNLGFAKAINQGLRRARGRYAVWLNSDAVVTDGWLDRLVAGLERAPWIGAVGPYTNHTSGLQRLETVGYSRLSGLPAFAQKWAREHRGRLAWAHRLTGFCLAHRTSALSAIGLLDERYELGCYEDLDFCLRLRQAGCELFIVEDAYVHHHGHKTFDRNGVVLDEQTKRNRELFIEKWCRHYLGVLDEADALIVRTAAAKPLRR